MGPDKNRIFCFTPRSIIFGLILLPITMSTGPGVWNWVSARVNPRFLRHIFGSIGYLGRSSVRLSSIHACVDIL